MCYIWQNPTVPAEEVSLTTLEKIPVGIDNLNLSGGEPTLRRDLPEIVDVLYPKARVFEISSNGLHPERLEGIIRKYPDIKVRFSLEGFEATNNRIRGEDDGFNAKVRGLRRLRQLGGRDLGFAAVMQDDNIEEFVRLYHFAREQGFEFATSALHNAFQFHKSDNYPYDRVRLAKEVERLVTEMLKTFSLKTWFRAYLNLGLIRKILGQDRLIPCTAATDFVFLDPWSDVFACNVRPDLLMGNLARQSWQDVFSGSVAQRIRRQVAACPQNCWMVTTARTAMRSRLAPMLPKWGPLLWVLRNKLRVLLGKPVDFSAIDYRRVLPGRPEVQRPSFLQASFKRRLQLAAQPHYQQGEFFNR
jgi:MoaA/NifB/PqqE/SkfB family radical SAM enzyme